MRARLVLLAAALVAFGASLGSGFHFDDYAIFGDSALRSGWGWLDIWGLRQTRPLTYLTFWLNYQVGGRDPLGYHLVNLALHLGAVLLAFECLRRLLPERAAMVGAALFAVHPIQAEAVNYVWGRSILLAALLCFASLLAWLTGRRWVALVCFAAALLAKEECAAFPALLLLLEWHRGRLRKEWPYAAAMLALASAAATRVAYAAASMPGSGAGAHAGISAWKYFLSQGLAIPRYLRLLIVPYGFTVDPDMRVPAVWLGLLAWAGIGAAAVVLWRSRRPWAMWALGGVLLLLPASSIFPAADLAADRRMYLPMFAFAAAAGLLLERVRPPAIATAVVVLLAAASVGRTAVWMSDARLWREAVERAPGKVRPKIQLSRVVPAAQALELLAAAATLAPYDAEVAAETGRVLLDQRQPEAALEQFGRALALDPQNAIHYNNRGAALEALGQYDAARLDFEHALSLDPGLTEARENLEKITGAR
jgi:protein O-mannosyl-transferase